MAAMRNRRSRPVMAALLAAAAAGLAACHPSAADAEADARTDGRGDGPLALLLRGPDAHQADLTVRIVAQEEGWLFAYPSATDAPSSPTDACTTSGSLALPADAGTRLLLSSDDRVHAWTVPSLGIDLAAIPGRVEEIVVRSDVAHVAQAADGPDIGFLDADDFARFKRDRLPDGC